MIPAADLSPTEALDELAGYLRPPGQGIHAVSTGKAELAAQTRAYLGPAADAPWRDWLAQLLEAPTGPALLAIPHDNGAGIVRGAARGPEAIRAALGAAPCLDLGDVFCVPHFLDEGGLSEAQRHRSQDALYADLDEAARRRRPVSPIGMATRALQLVRRLAPGLKIMALGGDHTVTWPVLDARFDEPPAAYADLGIVHFDAHTDLLPSRLGVPYCFATWAYHANERIGRGQRLVQIGIRASGHDRGHWESSLDVVQLWAPDVRDLAPEDLAARVLDALDRQGVRRVYVSNDLDGTDAHWAAACGTPEPGGLHPDQVDGVLQAILRSDLEVIGADLVELAPGLSLSEDASRRSVETATRYVRSSIALLEG